jgi:hypothetical protein
MCIQKGTKVAGMQGSDKWFEIFFKTGRLKLASSRNCRAWKFSVQDIHHEIVDGRSFGCKIYNSTNPEISGYKVG